MILSCYKISYNFNDLQKAPNQTQGIDGILCNF